MFIKNYEKIGWLVILAVIVALGLLFGGCTCGNNLSEKRAERSAKKEAALTKANAFMEQFKLDYNLEGYVSCEAYYAGDIVFCKVYRETQAIINMVCMDGTCYCNQEQDDCLY